MTAASARRSRAPGGTTGDPGGQGQPGARTGMFTHAAYTAMAAGEIDRMADLVRGADLTLRVPWSRTWRMTDLVHHVGAVHRWATRLVVTDARRYQPVRDTDNWPGSATAAEAARWLAAGRDPLRHALEAADPDHRMWAWGADQHARFWSRRMTHETGIHRADAELALGLEPRFEPAVAADGVSEFLANLWSARAWRRGMTTALRGSGQTLRFTAADTADVWVVERTAAGFGWAHFPAGSGAVEPGDVRVTGLARDLYLLAWKRIHPEDASLSVSGDGAVLAYWHRHSSV